MAMPGETDRTIRETTDFLKAVTQDARESPRSLMSLNYVQALPGTPVYEYARVRGLITAAARREARLVALPEHFAGYGPEEAVAAAMRDGLSRMDAIKAVARRRGLPKREVYARLEKSRPS